MTVPSTLIFKTPVIILFRRFRTNIKTVTRRTAISGRRPGGHLFRGVSAGCTRPPGLYCVTIQIRTYAPVQMLFILPGRPRVTLPLPHPSVSPYNTPGPTFTTRGPPPAPPGFDRNAYKRRRAAHGPRDKNVYFALAKRRRTQ